MAPVCESDSAKVVSPEICGHPIYCLKTIPSDFVCKWQRYNLRHQRGAPARCCRRPQRLSALTSAVHEAFHVFVAAAAFPGARGGVASFVAVPPVEVRSRVSLASKFMLLGYENILDC